MQAVTCQAIFSGLGDCSFKAALLDWALPYAQRYLQSVHPDKYTQLKHFGFDMVNRLRVVVVEKLFYQNVIKSFGIKSKKRLRCSCLLQVFSFVFHQACVCVPNAYMLTPKYKLTQKFGWDHYIYQWFERPAVSVSAEV